MTINEPKLLFIYLESIAWRLVVCDLNSILWKFSRRALENFTRSQKNKTVTFKDFILGIYGNNVNDVQALPHAFPLRLFNPTFAWPWRASVDVPSDFELFLTEITWDENL